MTVGQLEKLIGEEMTKIVKTNIGKGPSNIVVKVTKNFLIVEMNGILTTIEKTYLT